MNFDNQFLEKATNLFLENGAKTFTMDDVAKEFRISKKTLYQKYKNKEALLEEVMEYKLNLIITALKKINEDIEDAVERMYCRDEQIDEATRNNHNIFIKQLIKYYPDIFSRHMRIFSDRFSEVLIDNIRRGREQGVFRTDFDETLYPKLFFEMMLSYDSSITLDTEKISREYFKDTTMDFYMNAITTEKGKEAIKKYKNNQVNEKNSI